MENSLDVFNFVSELKCSYRKSGNELEIPCPFKECPNSGEKQFYINTSTGAWYCHRCGLKGATLKSLKFKLGLIEFKEPNISGHIYISPTKIEEYVKDLWANPEALDYLQRIRGFKRNTLVQFNIGYSQDESAIIIPYFDKSNACVGLKYHYFNKDQKPKQRFEKDSRVQLFGLHLVNLNEQLIITEGEYDAMTAWQAGFTNVGSCPNGATNTLGSWVEEIESAPSFIIAYDNDDAGNVNGRKLAERLGLSKCFRALLKLKDFNEYLQVGLNGKDIKATIDGAIPMFKAPIQSLSAYTESAILSLEQPETAQGISTGWESVNEYLGGIRKGEVTVCSGLTNHGKTTFSMSLVANLVRQGTKCLVLSPEMPEYELLLELANNHFKKDIKNADEVKAISEILSDKLYTANLYNEWTTRKEQSILDRTFDIIDSAVKTYNVDFILLDHMRLFLNLKDQDSERFAIDQFISKCVRKAIGSKVHIWLIVQPKNIPANQKKITLHDLKGSSNIGQDAHNVVLIHRNMSDKHENSLVEFEVAKVRSPRFGKAGKFVMEFSLKSKANFLETKGKS